MKAKKYDVFISYRRSSYDTANLIATRLRSAGYSVFFDMETLRSGKFNEQLYNVIETCTDFLLVLPPEALDRCVNEDDWVRLEIQHAMKHNKNIIPIMLNGFLWPNPMPEGLEELCNYQALTASSIEYFDLSMERLQKRYLRSKRRVPLRKLVKVSAIVLLSLLLLTGILWGVFKYLSRDVCTQYATQLVSEACAVHTIAEENDKLEKKWLAYENAYNYGVSEAKLEDMKTDLLENIELSEEYLKEYWAVSGIDSIPADIGAYHSFLLYINGIDAEDLSYSSPFATAQLIHFVDNLNSLRIALGEPSALNNSFATSGFTIFKHWVNIYYANLLMALSDFPETSLKAYNEVSPLWVQFPNHYEFGRDDEYYNKIVEKEQKLAERLLSEQVVEMNKLDAELKDFAHDNNTPGGLNDQMRAIDDQVTQFFEEFKGDCEFQDGDQQWKKWNKCYLMGSFIPLLINMQQGLYDEGFNFKLSVTPQMALEHTLSLLEQYESEFAGSKSYVAPTKAFFRAVAQMELPYSGVLVFGMLDNASHPTLKVGDIIVEYNGEGVVVLDDLHSGYQAKPDARFTVLRLVDGKLTKINFERLTDSEIIGLVDIVSPVEYAEE